MKKLLMLAMAMIVAVGTVSAQEAAAAAAPKEESPLSLAATLDLYSAYVWRGYVVNDRPVWQPGATVSYATAEAGTFSANVWANFDFSDHAGHRTAAGLNEIDYTLSYSIDVGPVTAEAGHIFYTFPKLGGKTPAGKNNYLPSTAEVYSGLAYNNDVVTPFVRAYVDYDEVNGLYGIAGLRKSVSVTDRFALGGELSLGAGNEHYMDYYFDVNGTEVEEGFADFNAALTATYALTDNLSIGAKLAYVSLVDGEARDKEAYRASGSFDKDLVWGGINLAASF